MNKGIRRPHGRSGLVSVAVLACTAAAAHAADWSNPVGGAWENAGNWLNSALPSSTNPANFAVTGTYDVSFTTSPNVSTIGVTSGDVGFLVPLGQNLQSTNFAIDSAAVRLNGGGFLSNGNVSLDRGQFTVSGVGTEIRTTNDLQMGLVAGHSVLNLNNSGVIGVRRLLAGVAPGSTAVVNVSGNANNSLFKGRNHVIGVAGAATLNIANEGRFNAEPQGTSPAITVGFSDGVNAGSGWVNIDGNISLMNLKGEVRVADGPGATGMFRVLGGGRAAFSGTNSVPVAMTVGNNGGAGEVFISGAGSNVKLNGQLAINQNLPTTVVRVETGGQMVASSVLYNGDSNSAKPGLIVKGLGAALSTSGDVNIASGDMLLTDTAVLDAGGTVRVGATPNDTADILFEGGSFHAGAIEIDGGNITLTRGTNKIIRTGSVAFLTPDAGVIDLADNAMMVDYFDAQPSPIDQVRAAIAPGPNSPTSMARIISSTASLDLERFGLGVAEGSQLPDAGAGLRSFFREAADNSSVLVRYTFRGDANLDGTVNIGDFANLAGNFGETGRWFDGDFNDDGEIGIGDFALLATNFNQVLPSSTDAARGTVPEPATFGLLSALTLLATRRRMR